MEDDTWHFDKPRLLSPLRQRAGSGPLASSPPGCSPWEGCPAACFTPALCSCTGIINAALRTTLSLLHRCQVGYRKEEIRLLSTYRKQMGASTKYFFQLHQPNKTPRIFIHSGDFPDRCLIGKTWLNFLEKALGGWRGGYHHFYRACLVQGGELAAEPGFPLCSEWEPQRELPGHCVICSVLKCSQKPYFKMSSLCKKLQESYGMKERGKRRGQMGLFRDAARETWHLPARLEEVLGKGV